MHTIERVEGILKNAIANKVFPGCSIAVIENEEITTQAFGSFTYEATSPNVTTGTLYDCASLTKIVGLMAIAGILLDEGVISLEDSVGTYLPEFITDKTKANAQIKHLMTYTLDFDIPGGSKSLMGTLSPVEVAYNATTYPLKHEPGTNYLYSNITAFLLTQVIERVTGQNFYELVQERIFAPLGMKTATFTVPESERHLVPPTEITPERGVVHGVVHDEFTNHTTNGGISNGAAGLFANIEDMAQFLKMAVVGGVYNDTRLFSEELVAEWTRDQFPHLLPGHTPLMWGDLNNHYIDQFPERNIVVKGGFTGCFMMADLTTKRAFVLLSNRTYPKRPNNNEAFSLVKEKLMELAFC